MLLPSSLRPDSKTSFQPFRLGFFLLVPPPPSPCALGRPSTRGKKRRGGGAKRASRLHGRIEGEQQVPPPLPLLRLQKRHPSPKRGGGREAQEKADQPSRQGEQEEGFSSQCACVRLLLLSLSFSPQPFFVPPLFSCSPLEPFSSSSSPFSAPCTCCCTHRPHPPPQRMEEEDGPAGSRKGKECAHHFRRADGRGGAGGGSMAAPVAILRLRGAWAHIL